MGYIQAIQFVITSQGIIDEVKNVRDINETG